MKSYPSILIVLSAVFATVVAQGAEKPEAAEAPKDGIVIASVGVNDEPLLRRVRAYVEKSYACPTRSLIVPDGIGEQPLAEKEQALAAQLRGNDVGVVAWIDIPGATRIREDIGTVPRVALLNLAKLRSDETNTKDNREQYARLAEKETVRLVALLLGMKPCPWPRCALHTPPVSSPHNIQGRNLCPPCGRNALQILRSKGIELDIGRAPATAPGEKQGQ